MTAWEEQIVRADAERARTLEDAWAVLGEDEWPGALDAFEAYLGAAEAVEAHQLLGTTQNDPDYLGAVAALVRRWEYLEDNVDGWSQKALTDHLNACVHWRSRHSTAFQALDPR